MSGQYEGENPYPPDDPRYFTWTRNKALWDASKEAAQAGQDYQRGTSAGSTQRKVNVARAKAAHKIASATAAEKKTTSAGMIAALIVAGGALLYILMRK